MKIIPKKSFGQNFLVNRGIVAKIIAAAELSKKDIVLEVGPGMGALTEELVKHAGRVIAVEKDKRLYEMLREKLKNARNLELVNEDVLKVKSSKFKVQNYKIVANIPYNITGQFFQNFLLADDRPQMIVVMVQKEVGERILGKSGRSLLTLAAELYGAREKICDVSPGSFNPPPKVTSMVIKMIASSSPWKGEGRRDLFVLNPPHPSFSKGGSPGRDFEMEHQIMRLAKIGFSSKRKKLISNLSTGLKLGKEKLKNIFSKIGFDENARAEELYKDDWLKLSRTFYGNFAKYSLK